MQEIMDHLLHSPSLVAVGLLSHWPLRNVEFFKLSLRIYVLNTSYQIGLGWVPQNPTDDEKAWIPVMAWCRQATSHYLSRRSQIYVAQFTNMD